MRTTVLPQLPPIVAPIWLALVAFLAANYFPLGVCNAPPLAAASFDASAFGHLSQHDRVLALLSMLDARDRSLNNIDYSVEELEQNVNKVNKDQRRQMSGYVYEMRRLGTHLWAHMQMHKAETAIISEDSVQNWDGRIGRRLALPLASGRPAQGLIKPVEFNCFGIHHFAALLGISVEIDSRTLSLTQWLRDCVQDGSKLEVVDETRNGRSLLILTVTSASGFERREIRVDPERGFMVVGFDQTWGDHQMDALLEVSEAIEIDGVWIPKRAIGRSTIYSSEEWTEFTHNLKNANIGTVGESDLDVTFPVGTFVVDATQNIAYTILPSGNFKLSPVAVRGAQTVYEPPENRIVKQIDANTSKAYVAHPLVSAIPEASRRLSNMRARAVLSVVVVLLILIAYIYYRRHDRDRRISGDSRN